jgi:hypothetical protein
VPKNKAQEVIEMRHGPWLGTFVCLLSLGAQAQIRTLAEVLAQQRAVRPIELAPQEVVESSVSPEAALKGMADAAGVVFTGELAAIRKGDGWVEMDWRVEEGVLGVGNGTIYVQREWSGLWASGDERYRVGQHAIVMLYAPSAAGFSSPVAGMDGVIPLRGDAVTGSVDLRWVMARVMRAKALAGGGVAQVRTLQAIGQIVSAEDPAAKVETDTERLVERPIVMGLLRSWGRSRVAAQ